MLGGDETIYSQIFLAPVKMVGNVLGVLVWLFVHGTRFITHPLTN